MPAIPPSQPTFQTWTAEDFAKMNDERFALTLMGLKLRYHREEIIDQELYPDPGRNAELVALKPMLPVPDPGTAFLATTAVVGLAAASPVAGGVAASTVGIGAAWSTFKSYRDNKSFETYIEERAEVRAVHRSAAWGAPKEKGLTPSRALGDLLVAVSIAQERFSIDEEDPAKVVEAVWELTQTKALPALMAELTTPDMPNL